MSSWVDQVRERADLVEVAARYADLKRSGKEYKACCPIHEEKTPSFYVVPAKGFYNCFGCGESGDVFDLVMTMEQVDFIEAARQLAEQFGVEVTERKPRKLSRDEKARLSQQKALTRDLPEGVWSDLGIGKAASTFEVGRVSADGTELLSLPIRGSDAIPLGWARYRIERSDGTARPIRDGFGKGGQAVAEGFLFEPTDLRTQLVKGDLVIVDDPLAVVRLRALGYGAAVAPARPVADLSEEEPLITDSQAQHLASFGIRTATFFVPVGGEPADRAHRRRILHASEPHLVRYGIEPLLALPGEARYRDSWSWARALEDAGTLASILADRQRRVDLFQLRVAAVARALAAGHLNRPDAIDKLRPTLAPAATCGDRALYQAYMAWAERAVGAPGSGTFAQEVELPSARDSAGAF